MKIKIARPGPSEPGFLRRQMAVAEFFNALKGDLTPESVQSIVDFLLEFTVEPKDKKEAEALIWEMSEEQYNEALAALAGNTGEVPPEAEGGSDAG